jgi:hypothetical protein
MPGFVPDFRRPRAPEHFPGEPAPPKNLVMAASAPEVSLNVQNAAPRQVEEATQKAVVRDYATAWQAITEALDRRGKFLEAIDRL